MTPREPVEVLFAFFREMGEWETKAPQMMNEARRKWQTEARAEAMKLVFKDVCEIFSKYCSGRPKWEDHKCYYKPPQYDPNSYLVDKVLISDERAEVTTVNTDEFRKGDTTQFILKRLDGEWKIDEKKQVVNGRKKSVDL